MKKIIPILIVICLAFSLSGCSDWNTTKEYRELKAIYESYEDGKEYTKETLFEQLGDPYYYQYKSLYNNTLSDEEKQSRKVEYFKEYTDKWSYVCNELSDSNPYALVVEFDADGNVTDMEFDYIPGG